MSSFVALSGKTGGGWLTSKVKAGGSSIDRSRVNLRGMQVNAKHAQNKPHTKAMRRRQHEIGDSEAATSGKGTGVKHAKKQQWYLREQGRKLYSQRIVAGS